MGLSEATCCDSIRMSDIKGWKAEILRRYSKIILIVYKDGDARGQIECDDTKEANLWLTTIAQVEQKEKLESKN